MLDLTVVTPTIPGRESLLAEAVASVFAQTLPVYAHYVAARRPDDSPGEIQAAKKRNSLLPSVTTEWVCTLDDDDLWLPHHAATIASALNPGVDVVCTFDIDGYIPCEDCTTWPQQRLIDRLDAGNFIFSGSAIRREKLLAVGGWPLYWNRTTHFSDDWALWRNLARMGAKFKTLPVATWRYRPGDWPRISTGSL